MITMHVSRLSIIPSSFLPLLYAGAMLVDAIAALVFGWMYDKYGIKVLIFSDFLSAFFALFIFTSHSISYIIIGIALWGIGMGAQESILKSAVTALVPKENRSTGFGVFGVSFGVCWFIGSWVLGILYDTSIPAMVTVSVISLKSATKPLNVLIAFTRPLITEFADNLNLKHPLLPTISPYPTM
jgi:MFS family permease